MGVVLPWEDSRSLSPLRVAMIRRSLLLALIGLLGPAALLAQDSVPEASRPSLAAIGRLEFTLGRWMQTVYSTPDDGATWVAAEPIPVEAFTTLGGLFLEERGLGEGDGGTGFVVEQVIGYDQYRQVYRMMAMDNVWGLPDLYTGVWTGGALVLDNLDSGTSYVDENGVKTSFRLTFRPDGPDRRTVLVERSLDDGSVWTPYYRSVFERMR